MPTQRKNTNGMRSVKEPKRLGSQKRVADLLASGARLFADKGFEAVTMTEIAANAGASIGSLYQYFPSKEQLAATLYASQIDSILTILGQLKHDCAGAPADVFCERLFACLTEFLARNVSFAELNMLTPVDANIRAQARHKLRADFKDVLTAIKPPVPAERRSALAAVIVHLVNVTVQITRDNDTLVRERAIGELRTMLAVHMTGQSRD